jgi:hypothetical protein
MTSRKAKVRAVVHEVDGDREITVTGRQNVRTLEALVASGPRGVTALDISSWAMRLSHYIMMLRHNYGLPILTEREPHDGGEHGRYRLLIPVTLKPSEVQQ